MRSSRSIARDQVVDGVEVGGDVVADGGVRAAAGLHGRDALVGQHGVPAQEVGVLGGVDVVGQHRQRQFVAQLAAQRGHQRGLARTDGSADADAQRLAGVADPARAFGMGVGLTVEQMWWHGAPFGIRASRGEEGSVALGVALGQHVEQRVGQVGEFLGRRGGGLVAQRRRARR